MDENDVINTLKDGETYSTRDLVETLGLKSEECVKKWLKRKAIPAVPVGSHWWVAGEDIRGRMRELALARTGVSN